MTLITLVTLLTLRATSAAAFAWVLSNLPIKKTSPFSVMTLTSVAFTSEFKSNFDFTVVVIQLSNAI